VATGPYAGEGFDCPALDTLFLAAPVASKGSLTQYAGRILRSHENKTTAEVHDYLHERTGVLAAMLTKRAPGYTGPGFPDPRKIALTPSASTDTRPAPQGRAGTGMRTQWCTHDRWPPRKLELVGNPPHAPCLNTPAVALMSPALRRPTLLSSPRGGSHDRAAPGSRHPSSGGRTARQRARSAAGRALPLARPELPENAETLFRAVAAAATPCTLSTPRDESPFSTPLPGCGRVRGPAGRPAGGGR
jgi:hypothetical protein